MIEKLLQLQAGKVYECSDNLGYYGRLKFVGMISCEQISLQDSVYLVFEDIDEAHRRVHISLDTMKDLTVQLADQSFWRYWKKSVQYGSLHKKIATSAYQSFRKFLSFN